MKNIVIEILNLKYNQFIEMLQEINQIATYFIQDDGSTLSFQIVKGTDTTFLWKLTTRIECSKYRHDSTDIISYRILRLNEFLNIYKHIKLQFNELESLVESNKQTQLTLYESMLSENTLVSDDEICCICMERKSNLILNCTHNYCEECIHEWQVTSTTCPICRCKSGEHDAFILADKPHYMDIQDEMSKSLFQITDYK